jgi:hypothetical protein
LIVLVEVVRVEEEVEAGSSWKVSLTEKIVLVLLAVEEVVVKEGSGFLPFKAGSRSCYQGCAMRAG